jgi:hypothetical protein
MSPAIYITSMCFMFGTILIVFAMKYLSGAHQAQSRALADAGYKALAETATAVQSQSATALTALQDELSEIKTRLASVEKILKAVE